MAWPIAGALMLWMGIRAASAGYSSRISHAQCYTDTTPYSGDVLHNPIFGGGGSIGSLTLKQCQNACDEETDEHGRSCVAIEWKDGGSAKSGSATKLCALAWACDWTQYWDAGSVFMRDATDLVWHSWAPGSVLGECEGDCDNDADCSGALECYYDGVPPGCAGSAEHYQADYCYDPSSSAKTAFAERPHGAAYYPPDPDQTPWTVALSGKDLAIFVLMAINVVAIVAVCFVCARRRAPGSRKMYQAVRIMGDSEAEAV